MYEEQPQGPAEVDNRPLDEKIGDKNWKARVSAYEELRRELKNTLGEDPLFDEYARWVPKMTADSNAGALDAGLDTALVYVDICPSVAIVRNMADAICSNVCDKAFGSRAITLNKGKLLIMKLMEVDDCSTCSSIMISKLSDKKPKVPPTCLEIFKQGISSFGAKAFPIKELISNVGPILNGSNAPAREAAMCVLVELYKWIGRAPFNSLVESMRPAQKTEFEKLCSEHDASGSGVPTPSLYLRKNRPVPGSDAVSGGGKPSGAPAADTIDAREFVEEIDLGKRMKASEYDSLIAEQKWSDQLRGLQIVVDILGPTPKIKSGTDVSDLLGAIRGFLRQGHVQLQTTSLRIVALLADGLRAEFGPAVRPLTQAVIQKSKEKRLVGDVQVALVNIITHCLSMDALIDDLSEHISNKKTPPHARVCLMEFVLTAMQTCPAKIATDCLKSLVEMHISCCEDSDVKVRDTCSSVLGALAPLVRSRGRSAVDAHKLLMALEQTVPRVFKKMQTAMDVAPAASMQATAPAAAPKAPEKPPAEKSAPPKKTTVPAAKPAAKSSSAPVAVKKNTTTSARVASSAGASDDKEDDNVDDVSMGLDEAQSALAVLGIDGWDSSFQALMNSAKWQDRVDACTVLGEAIQSQSLGGSLSVPLVAFLKGHNNGFKMSNVNIVKAVMQVAVSAAQSVGDAKFSKSAAWELMKSFGERFSDKKTQDVATALTTALCEATSPAFVVKRMKVVIEKVKAPSAHQGYLEWLKSAISEFGAGSFPIQNIAFFCKEEMENKVAGVRTAAVEVVGALYHQIGPRVQSIAVSDDIKPQLKALLEAEFAKVGHDPAASGRATRAVKGDAGAAPSGGLTIPRQDLTAVLDKNILSELNCTDGKNSWQQRKAAMEAILGVCESSGHYLEGNKGTVEIIRAFKARLNDTQANLKPLAANVMAHIIASFECEQAVKVLRVMAGCLLASVADSKKAMRDAVIIAFDVIVTLNGTCMPADGSLMSVMMTTCAEALSNPVGRQELLQWMSHHVDGEEVHCDCSEIAGSLVLCLQDKMAAVRTLTENVLTVLISKGLINRHAIDKATRDLAPATKRALQGPLDRMLASFGTRSVTAVTETATHAAHKPAVIEKPSELPKKVKAILAKPAASMTVAAAVPAESVASQSFPFKKTNKTKRNDEFYRQNWPAPPEDIGGNELQNLKREWETQVTSTDIIHLLFPQPKVSNNNAGGQDTFISAIDELISLLSPDSENDAIVIMHTDFILRWAAYVLCCRESTAGLLKVLSLITSVFELHRRLQIPMHDAECGIILPQLIDRSGHKQDRQKAAYKSALQAAANVCAPAKICSCLLQGLSSKNKKTRAVCLEEMENIVTSHSYACLGKAGLKEICGQLDSSDVGVRNAALDLSHAIYVCVGNDLNKLYKIMPEVSDKSKSLLTGRIKEKSKAAANAPPPVPPQAMHHPVVEIAPPVPPSPVRAAPKVAITQQSADKSFVLRGGSRFDNTATESPNEGELAFKLEMTPEAAVNASPTASKMVADGRTPAVDNVKVSLFGQVTPEPNSVSLDGVYAEIAAKVNKMTTLYSSYLNDQRQGIKMAEPKELQIVCDDCREYMKMLHAIVTDNWSKGKNEATAAADDETLIQNAEGLVLMVLTCLSLSLEGVGVTTRSAADTPVAVALDIDVSLASVSLATLHALVKHPKALSALSPTSLVELVSDCVCAISHEKLDTASVFGDAKEASTQMHRVLLLILAKSAQQVGVAPMVCAILQALFQCITEVDHNALGDSIVTRRLLPTRCAKPLSKLLLKVLSDECRQTRPFVRLSAGHVSNMLAALHRFFSNHPSDLKGDDTPYCAAKTVLSQLVKSMGAASVLMTLQETLNIQPNSFVCIMTARLGNTEVSTSANNNNISSGDSDVSPELHSTLVSIIDDITSSRDKMGAIKKLYVLIKNNPTLDVSHYLQRTSSVFRRYVLDTLQQMDEQKSRQAERALKGNSAENENYTTAGRDIDPINRGDDIMGGHEGFEAMRIIAELKKNSQSETPSKGIGRESSASRLAIHDKVRGSLSSLQESLFAGGREIPTTKELGVGASIGATPSTAVNPMAGVDDDLAARIARIRNVNNKM